MKSARPGPSYGCIPGTTSWWRACPSASARPCPPKHRQPQPDSGGPQDRGARPARRRTHPEVQRLYRFAAADIPAGTYVHSHNLAFQEFDRDYAHARDYVPTAVLPEAEQARFQGIVRANGQVGTRNYIGIMATVNCSATVVHRIAAAFTPEVMVAYPNVDGVVALSHGMGCGMEMSGEPMDLLRRTMADTPAMRTSRPC